jgi:hypothetical protein
MREILQLACLVASMYAPRQVESLRAVSLSGKPVPGVKIYACNSFGGEDRLLGVTNSVGLSPAIRAESPIFGIAPDGRLAIDWRGRGFRFARTGTIRVRLQDGRGRPLTSKRLWLFPTTVPLRRKHGLMRPLPRLPMPIMKRLSATTNHDGIATFTNLPAKALFWVAAKLWMPEPYTFGGTVSTGTYSKLVLDTNGVITGKVSRMRSGEPAAGLQVILRDTHYGHMSAYPGRTLRSTKTDAYGRYILRDLPNCEFGLMLSDSSRRIPEPFTTAARVGNGTWQHLDYKGPYTENTLMSIGGEASVVPSPLATHCVFRWALPAQLTLKVQNPDRIPPSRVSLTFWTSDRTSGLGLKWPSNDTIHCVVPSGNWFVVASDDEEDVFYLNQKLEIGDGEAKTIFVTLKKPNVSRKG